MSAKRRRRTQRKAAIRPSVLPRARQHTSAEPDLLADVRRALTDRHPLSLLSYVSTLLCVTDTRRNHPFARADAPDPRALTREELVRTFVDVPVPETSALLAVIAEMAGDDDVLRARIRRELAARPKVEPACLAKLSETSTYRAVRMSHVLGDGDNIMLGARLPGGHELTCLVYIDHNLGTLVKDAFVVPASIANMVAEFRRVTEDPDTRWDDVSLADARAWVDAAIELAAITFPPLETESWPACRALVEWITRGLPEGGTGYQRPQWDSAAFAGLTDRFFASPYGARLDDPDHRGLLESLLWYGTDYGPGDPLRWSPVKVEILLDDWIPRKIVAPAEYLAKAPDLLRAFIRFAHAEVGLRVRPDRRDARRDRRLGAAVPADDPLTTTAGAGRAARRARRRHRGHGGRASRPRGVGELRAVDARWLAWMSETKFSWIGSMTTHYRMNRSGGRASPTT